MSSFVGVVYRNRMKSSFSEPIEEADGVPWPVISEEPNAPPVSCVVVS